MSVGETDEKISSLPVIQSNVNKGMGTFQLLVEVPSSFFLRLHDLQTLLTLTSGLVWPGYNYNVQPLHLY